MGLLDQAPEQQRVHLVGAEAESVSPGLPREHRRHRTAWRTRDTSTCSALTGLAGRSPSQTASISPASETPDGLSASAARSDATRSPASGAHAS